MKFEQLEMQCVKPGEPILVLNKDARKIIKLYREKNCCSLTEAKSAVYKIRDKMDGGADDAAD